ncbi:Glycosyltransferase involved in cell wall biogenesis [Treponema sp. JC4]|uniref:glycosyltransferase family 2 protein n=1 Tax=Treponema sp. JC4 TaxID=1124982 RepID=UPI00025B0D4F|nr:glycosyltransferase family 2 protein [Treponema sp. JC4]EID86257.1 Glycosyltransferase involved in cell wall biogenesis [Treponema sp. JC4]
MKQEPKISVCIPVFNSERQLKRCLDSVISQDFPDFEIVIVNDGSTGTDEKGLVCRKIVKQAEKDCKRKRKEKGQNAVPFNYTEHRSNLGLLEARRTAIENARSEYICILDSDDILLPCALTFFWDVAFKTNADIVQAHTDIYCEDTDSSSVERIKEINTKYNNVFEGELTGSAVFDSFLINQSHIGLLWAKLIRREVYLAALSHIPFTHCVMSEDMLQYFFIAYEAKKYVGIKNTLYRYTADTGISSNMIISDLARWEKICTTANVFAIIFEAIKEYPEGTFSLEQMEALRLQSRSYLVNNIQQMRKYVIPELQNQAHAMLCDYWGEDFVNRMEQALDKKAIICSF